MAIANARIINRARLEAVLLQAFETWTKEDVNEAHWDDQFKEEKWKHSPLTVRANGEQVGSPRDIYDLGALYQSGVDSYTFTKGTRAAEAKWHWDAKNSSGQEYARYVHDGTGTNSPYPRPFTDDISIPSSFFQKGPGMALVRRVQAALDSINAR